MYLHHAMFFGLKVDHKLFDFSLAVLNKEFNSHVYIM